MKTIFSRKVILEGMQIANQFVLLAVVHLITNLTLFVQQSSLPLRGLSIASALEVSDFAVISYDFLLLLYTSCIYKKSVYKKVVLSCSKS